MYSAWVVLNCSPPSKNALISSNFVATRLCSFGVKGWLARLEDKTVLGNMISCRIDPHISGTFSRFNRRSHSLKIAIRSESLPYTRLSIIVRFAGEYSTVIGPNLQKYPDRFCL